MLRKLARKRVAKGRQSILNAASGPCRSNRMIDSHIVFGGCLGGLVYCFHYMRVEPKHISSGELKLPKLWRADLIRTAVCFPSLLGAFANSPLANDNPMTGLSLALMSSPLMVPSPYKPSAGDSASFKRYAGLWLQYKIDVGVKTVSVSGIAWTLGWLISKVPGPLSTANPSIWLEEHFGYLVPASGHIVIPIAVVLVAVFMLVVRSMLLGSVNVVNFLVGLVYGSIGIFCFYNLNLCTAYRPSAAVTGVLLAVIWSLGASYAFARIDRRLVAN